MTLRRVRKGWHLDGYAMVSGQIIIFHQHELWPFGDDFPY